MRIPALLPTVFIASVSASALAAQTTRVGPGMAFRLGPYQLSEPRAVIGVSTTNGASSRDTLGVLVAMVRAGSPAEKAGIEEGNRIASINGVSLRLAAADVGDEQMSGIMSRRLQRELDRLKPGDDVDLQVYADGKMRHVKVKTVAPSELYDAGVTERRAPENRAALGMSIASTGNSRDTIGVFVMSVDEDGPAAKAGITEGVRIASINGVELGDKRREADDERIVRISNISRFERELAKVRPGDDVELRVYDDGQYRNVKVKAARASDLPRRSRTVTIIGGNGFGPDIERLRLDMLGADVGERVRRVLDEVRVGARAFDGFGRGFGSFWGGRLDW